MTRLNTGAIQDALGLQGGEQIPFLPTVVMADFSETVVGEFIEARGVAAVNGEVDVVNDRHAVFALASVGKGGLVIADLHLRHLILQASAVPLIAGHPEDCWGMKVVPGNLTAVAGLTEIAHINVGAAATQSMAGGAFNEAGTITPEPVNFLPGDFHLQPGVRWLIPGGSVLLLQSNADRRAGDDITVEFTVTWRELPPAAR